MDLNAAGFDLDAALIAHPVLATLLIGAAIQGYPRRPIALDQLAATNTGQMTPMWWQMHRGGTARVILAGSSLPHAPGPGVLTSIMSTLARVAAPDVVHLFLSCDGDIEELRHQLAVIEIHKFTFHIRSTSYRYALLLGGDYEAFVGSLGRHSRRNIRLFHRRAAADGLTFSFQASPPPLDPAACAERITVGGMTRPKPKPARRMAELEAFIAARQRPFHSTMRGPQGQLLSLTLGFMAGQTGYLVMQANHGGHPDSNLGLTHRSMLIRALIGEGMTTFVSPNGMRDVLHHACQRDQAVEMVLMKDSFFSRWRVRRWRASEPTHPAVRFIAKAESASRSRVADSEDAVSEPVFSSPAQP